MILIKPSFEILKIMCNYIDLDQMIKEDPLQLIEYAGRTCYKSEDKITPDSAKDFVKRILKSGHESVIEHSAMTVKVICDRGVTHEIVRHRIGSYSQESTRYVNYKGGCTFVIPPWIKTIISGQFKIKSTMKLTNCNDATEQWFNAMLYAEAAYTRLLDEGWTPQQARSVLPNSTKTEIVITYNFREWRHFFKLRTSNAAHPQMQEIARPLLDKCKELIPVIFDDITY
jgi:thymidylate synthase (FAD)